MRRSIWIIVFHALLPLLLAGCDDDVTGLEWISYADTVQLYSFTLQRPNLPNAYDLLGQQRVEIEDPDVTGTWDFAIGMAESRFLLLPPGALGIDSNAGAALFAGMAFEDVTEAPTDSLSYVTMQPLFLAVGNVYVIRTRGWIDANGLSCVNYGKVAPISTVPDLGLVRFVYDINPGCDDRRLVP